MSSAPACPSCAPARAACTTRSTPSTANSPTGRYTSNSPTTSKTSSPGCAARPPQPPSPNASASCACSSKTCSSAPTRSPSATPSRYGTTRTAGPTTAPKPTRRAKYRLIANCVGGVISPLLANVYLHVLDTELATRGVGELVRYADDGVVLCRSAARAEHALAALGEILAALGLRLHPDKTKVVDLRQGREGLDFLGCHFRARMSGRLWEQQRIVRYYLHRWPSQTALARVRAKVREHTGRHRVGVDIRDVIADLNPVLRGWVNYFHTGNAGIKFGQIDRYVVWRLFRLMVKKRGRNLRAGQAGQWTEEWFNGHGLHRLRGTIRYPKAA